MLYKMVLLSLGVLLCARENPFATALDPSMVGMATKIKQERVEFNRTVIPLPSSARILKSVSVIYQSLDGAINEEVVAINQDVNWHHPLILMSQTPPPPEVTLPTPPATKAPPPPKPDPIPQPKTPDPKPILSKTVTLVDGLSIRSEENTLFIATNDKKIRDFLMTEPYKVVVDFAKSKGAFPSKTVPLTPPFVTVTRGNHEGFYRLAIALDGHYRYDIGSVEGGYRIVLK